MHLCVSKNEVIPKRLPKCQFSCYIVRFVMHQSRMEKDGSRFTDLNIAADISDTFWWNQLKLSKVIERVAQYQMIPPKGV